MLVLSRRPGQRIQFPAIGVTVEVLAAGRQSVRLGIEAPPEIKVLREELAAAGPAVAQPRSPTERHSHQFRGRLNTAMMALYLAERQLAVGLDAGAAMREALASLDALNREVEEADRRQEREIEALLVEDDHNEQALLAGYLRMCGIRIRTARDGDEALAALATQRPDIVLLDMHMQGRDGPATVAAIRRNEAYRDLRIFGVSGSAPEEVGLTTGAGGVDAWFRKPLSPARLVEAMTATRSVN